MGGGATMRAVGKAAGIGLINSGICGRLSEHPVSAATRVVTHPTAAIGGASAAESIKPIESNDDASAMKKSISEIDDWDFAELSEESVGYGDKKLARVVFRAPTFEEAKEAISELKEVLEKDYLTKTASPKFMNIGQDSSLSFHESSEVWQNKSCLTIETAESTHAVQAFKFLNESPAIQGVVASIASDPNVWKSLLGNPTLQDYLLSQNIDLSVDSLQRLYPGVEESFGDGHSHVNKSPEIIGDADDPESHQEDFLINAWNNTKDAVNEMMNNLSGFFQNLFGGGKMDSDSNAANTGFIEKALGPSLMGLVIMVIMLVVFKRP